MVWFYKEMGNLIYNLLYGLLEKNLTAWNVILYGINPFKLNNDEQEN